MERVWRWHPLAVGAVVTNVKMQQPSLDGTLKILFAE